MLIGFGIWIIVSLMFVGFGISAFRSQEAVGFWANAKTPEMEDVKSYNRAVGKLWVVFGMVFAVWGFPFLIAEQNSPLFFISMVGVMIQIIVTVVIYTLRIEAKYRKK